MTFGASPVLRLDPNASMLSHLAGTQSPGTPTGPGLEVPVTLRALRMLATRSPQVKSAPSVVSQRPGSGGTYNYIVVFFLTPR